MCPEFAGRCSLWEQAPVLLAEEAFPFQVGADAGEQLRVDRFPSGCALLGVQAHRRLLDGDARVREIAQMLSGSDVSEAAINNAKELLRK